MKIALKILFVVSMAGLIAACGPQGNKNNIQTTPQNQQNQNTSSFDGGRHHGGKLRRICAADIQKFCGGQNKVRKCLRNISDQLQPDCKIALQQAIERRRERKLEREQRNNTGNTQTQGQQPLQNQPNTTQPQNQAAPQNGQQHNNSANDDDDDD